MKKVYLSDRDMQIVRVLIHGEAARMGWVDEVPQGPHRTKRHKDLLRIWKKFQNGS